MFHAQLLKLSEWKGPRQLDENNIYVLKYAPSFSYKSI